MFNVNDVIQFNENLGWCGCLGIINEVKKYDEDTRYLVGVPAPQQGTAYIFVMESDNAIEYIGRAVLIANSEEEVK